MAPAQERPIEYPQLAIRDDNGDGMIEVNRPEEIDALLEATSAILKATSFPMQGTPAGVRQR